MVVDPFTAAGETAYYAVFSAAAAEDWHISVVDADVGGVPAEGGGGRTRGGQRGCGGGVLHARGPRGGRLWLHCGRECLGGRAVAAAGREEGTFNRSWVYERWLLIS